MIRAGRQADASVAEVYTEGVRCKCWGIIMCRAGGVQVFSCSGRREVLQDCFDGSML
uniref:Uncharacterized protein n=1 Tax=Physcomitrium patens TaxID=3218 RepID=A0A7I4E7Y3_PHYPA